MNTDGKGASHMEKKKRHFKKSLISLLAVTTLILLSSGAAQQKKPEVPYVPTPDEVVAEMLKMANVGKNDVLYDLGCGDGRIVITAAKKFGCRGVGIDIDPVRIRESRENAIKAGVSDRVRFIQADLFDAEISKATVVTLYLLSKVNLRLRPKLFRELDPGTRVVSHQFSMEKWEPDATSSVKLLEDRELHIEEHWDLYQVEDWDLHTVYSWIIPGNVSGIWKLTIPDISRKNELTLKLDQEFQRVRGEAFEGASSIPIFIEDEKIKGNIFQFTLERKLGKRTEKMHFKGSVEGHDMKGTLKIEGSPGKEKLKWEARRVVSTIRPINIKDSSEREYFIIK